MSKRYIIDKLFEAAGVVFEIKFPTIESYVGFLNSKGLKATLRDGKIDVVGDVWSRFIYIEDEKIVYPFGKINGGFSVSGLPLHTLEGAPKYVGGFFDCSSCRNLTTLKGAPRHVEGHFDCSNCINLTSLEGAPEYVGDNFYCAYCPNLTSLKGLKVVKGKIYVRGTPIKDFSGFSKDKVKLSF